ncbi:MAG: hypothetical protein WAS21_21950 [Geminicoccaceae bacterium]
MLCQRGLFPLLGLIRNGSRLPPAQERPPGIVAADRGLTFEFLLSHQPPPRGAGRWDGLCRC